MLVSVKSVLGSLSTAALGINSLDGRSFGNEARNLKDWFNFKFDNFLCSVLGVSNDSPATRVLLPKFQGSTSHLRHLVSQVEHLVVRLHWEKTFVIRWRWETFIQTVWTEVALHVLRCGQVRAKVTIRCRTVICRVRLIATPTHLRVFKWRTVFVACSRIQKASCAICGNHIATSQGGKQSYW